ncbi:MAG: hypothetical protein ACRDBY_01065 [Cetobacterium sp.]
MKNSASGNPNWQVMNGTDYEVRKMLIENGLMKECKNKVLGTYFKISPNSSFGYEIANNAILEKHGIKFRCEII